MRKILAILLMFLVCSMFILSLNNKPQATDSTKHQSTGVENSDMLGELKEVLETNYPKTPKEVIEINNKIMAYQYSEAMVENEVEQVVALMRLMYTDELNALNHENEQSKALKEEIILNLAKDLYLVESTIELIHFTHENIAEVEVNYKTTQDEVKRVYTLIRENEQWKIHNWQ